MDLTRINDGIADRDTCFNLLNRYQETIQNLDGSWTTNPNHMELKAGQFFEITPEEYWYFLEVLPPLYQSGGAFAMSEFIRGDLTNAFFGICGRYFCATVAIEADEVEFDEDAYELALHISASSALKEAQAGIAYDMAGRVFA